jgi:CheY-like chemotaxis protein
LAKVLIIEDDIAVRFSLVGMLEDMGYEVTEAEDGRKGIECYFRDRPDLVVTDMLMPNVDGIEVINILRNDCEDVKILAISSGGKLDAHGYLEVASIIGASAILTKPIDRDVFLQNIVRLLGDESSSS